MPTTVRAPRTGTGTRVTAGLVRVDGLTMRVWTVRADAPDDDARPVASPDHVLVHGLGASAATFEALAPRLARHGRVHLLDLPGFARVPRPGSALTIEDLGALVARWVERIDRGPVVLVGHSMGAQVVAEAAAVPGVASHAVLVGPTVDDAARTAVQQAVRLARSSMAEPRRTQALLVRSTLECGARWYGAELRQMLRHDVAARVPTVEAPVLVVRGEHDRLAPPRWADRLAASAPRGRSVTVPGAAHAVMHTHAREVADLVLAHVAT